MAITLYVGNLPWSMTEDALAELCSAAGRVCAVRIITERASGRSRGFGFVEVEGVGLEDAVKALGGVEIGGRRLTVGPGHPRPVGQ